MKKSIIFAFTVLVMFASCSKEINFSQAVPEPATDNSGVSKAYLKKTFGVAFDPNHDWCTTKSGVVTINVDASVKEVQLMGRIREASDDEPEWVTKFNNRLLNKAETKGRTSITLNYDAPKDNEGLYVGFVTDDSYYVREVVNDAVSFSKPAQARTRRAGSEELNYSATLTGKILSYGSERGYVNGEEYLWATDNYGSLMIPTSPYSLEFIAGFRNDVLTYYPNGRNYNNISKVMASGYYNATVYCSPLNSTSPVIVTPVYKCDNPTRFGNEVYNSDLYYYYFTDEEIAGKDPVAYIQSLPKFKALSFSDCFGDTEDNEVYNHGSYVLIYYGKNSSIKMGSTGDYKFPENINIGFMVRAMTSSDGGRKKGEVYGDGRLNNGINNDKNYNFSSSSLGTDGPRAAWLSYDGRMFLSWESGTDSDYNDIFLEISGIKPFVPIIIPDPEIYTYCFEDRTEGDYDMNDLVIKVTRINETTLEYSIVACGAYDELYVYNVDCGVIQNDKEVHALFGTVPESFINTVPGETPYPVITAQKTVDSKFSVLAAETQPYIVNKTQNGLIIHVAKQKEEPHGILIPYDFAYPKEKCCIKNAYKDFNNWGQNPVISTDWYIWPEAGNVY